MEVVLNNVAVKPLKTVFIWSLLALLTACSTVTRVDIEPVEETKHVYLATVNITSEDSPESLMAKYGGEVVSFLPEAGFAVLGFSKEEGELTTLDTSVNQDALASPEVTASGRSAWAGGFSAWAGGRSAWAGGFSAWAGGWSAWASGNTAPAVPSGNETLWRQIKLHEAHDAAINFGSGVKVAILDTGIDLNHPVFAGRLAPANEWKDFVDNDNNPQEEGTTSDAGFGHGTAVAGIIAQIAPKATLLPLRVLDKDGSGDLDDVIMAVEWAIQKGADIINFSLGSYDYYLPLHNMIEYAGQNKVMMIASSGNDARATVTYPAQMAWWQDTNIFPYMYGIGSIDSSNRVSDFSNFSGIISQAPGEQIVTSYPGEQLTLATGTSFAAPVTTGVLALALSDYHLEDPYSLFVYMGNTGQWPENYSSTGYGLIDANAILRSAQGQAGYSFMGEGWLNNFTFWDWQTNAEVTSNGYDGWQTRGAEITGQGGMGQIIRGLRPNTTYTFNGYLRVDEPGASIAIGVKDYGGQAKYSTITNSNWTWTELSFTTGPNSTSAEVTVWNNAANTKGYADSFWLGR